MPQLDILNWFNQVSTTTILALVFYYLLFLNFIPFFMGLLKSRAKIHLMRILINNIFNKQVYWFVYETILSLQSFIASALMIIFLYNKQVEDVMIKNWLFRETTLWHDLEEFLVKQEVFNNYDKTIIDIKNS